MKIYEDYIHTSRYARWLPEESRRETWIETVDRVWNYLCGKAPVLKKYPEVRQAIIDKEVMPSMRVMMTAGPALERNHISAYNCAYLAIDNIHAFDEALMVLMCGTGVGYSVERQYINQLPEVPAEIQRTEEVFHIADSKQGWARGLRTLIDSLYKGEHPTWDTSRIRPKGSRLKTFGGRASGPEPLENLLRFVVKTFYTARGRRLSSLECHDIMCAVASAVIVGGVRRSAMICLSNLSDDRMRHAKSGNWINENVSRSLANISTAYTEKPDLGSFLREMQSLYESKSGERGIFNRMASNSIMPLGRNISDFSFGTNPCGEIILRSKEFCNLTEAVIRSDDTLRSIRDKVRIATILGTVQSSLTDFKYLSKGWKNNCEEERLLGVSLTGIYDNTNTSDVGWCEKNLKALRETVWETNKEWAKKLKINPSVAMTCVKPSGTVSQLVNSGSGIHPRYAHHYIRRVRNDKSDPLATWMIANGFPFEDDIYNDSAVVFSFPIATGEDSTTRKDISALQHLELWKAYKEYWTDHNPSVTIYVGEDEWLEVFSWVWKHWDMCCGLTFLPRNDSDHVYAQAPYEEITKDDYDKLVNTIPDIDFSAFVEEDDQTTASQELACTAGVCEI